MIESFYVGILERLSGTTGWLRPLAQIHDDGLPTPVDDVQDVFPERGFVPWFHINPVAVQGSLWSFTIRASPSFDPSAGRTDKYTIDGVPEQIDRRVIAEFDSEEEALRKLSAGIEANHDERDVSFVIVDKRLLVGPIRLRQLENGLTALDPKHRDIPINVSDLRQHGIYDLHWERQRWNLLWPQRSAWTRESQLDWGTDQAVLARGLRCLGDLMSDAQLKDLAFTKNIVASVSQRIASTSLSSIDRYRIERSIAILNDAAANTELAEALELNVLELRNVQKAIEEAKLRAKVETTSALKAAEHEVLGQLRTDRIRLEGEVELLHSEINGLIEEKSIAKEELDDFLSSVTNVVRHEMEILAAKPGELIGKSIVLQAATTMRPPHRRVLDRQVERTAQPWVGRAEILAQLHRWADYHALDAVNLICLSASVLAGHTAVLTGDRASVSVEALTSALFASPTATRVVACNPGYLSPVDLLKDLYQHGDTKQDSGTPSLLILDGVDRCVTETVVLPFLHDSDPGGLRSGLGAGPNLSIVCSISNNTMSLPIPRQLWDNAAHHAFMKTDRRSMLDDGDAIPTTGQVSIEAVQEIRARFQRQGAWRGFIQYLPSLSPSASTVRRCDRLEHALVSLGLTSLEAVRHTFRCCLARELVDCPGLERQNFLAVIPDAQSLTNAISTFQDDLMKREE